MPRPALRAAVLRRLKEALKKLLRGGIEQVRVVLRAVGLQRLGEGMRAPRIAAIAPLTRQSIRNLARRYEESGLKRTLYEKQRPGAENNLSTHTRKSLTDLCGEGFGAEIWACFTPHYTPTHGSWLNLAEIEIGLFTRQCLDKRRIPDMPTLRGETAAGNRRVNRYQIKIDWKLDRKTARRTFRYKRPRIRRSAH